MKTEEIYLGQIVKPFGIKGELKLLPSQDFWEGVLESDDKDEILAFGKKIFEGNDNLLIEEFLEGYELSIFALTDGKTYKLLPPSADFKKANDGDTGPNTGGMGSICPVFN